MSGKEIVLFMLDSIKQDNYLMGKQSGMTEEQIKESFVQSEASLTFIVQNLYSRMKEQKIIP